MTGLNLETFLRILRADLGAWASLGVVAVILGIMTWTSWGSKRALRKCLFLSIAAHVGLIVYGGSSPEVRKALRLDPSEDSPRPERPVRITPVVTDRSTAGPGGEPTTAAKVADWDLDRGSLAFGVPNRLAAPTPASREGHPDRVDPGPVANPSAAPELAMPTPSLAAPERPAEPSPPLPTPEVAEGDSSEVAAPVAAVVTTPDVPPPSVARSRAGPNPPRPAPERSRPIGSALPEPPRVDVGSPRISGRSDRLRAEPTTPDQDVPATPATDLDPDPPVDPSPVVAPPPPDASPSPAIRRPSRLPRDNSSGPIAPNPTRSTTTPALPTVTPAGPSNALASARPAGRRPPQDVPQIYRSRLDPNRTALAQRAGATLESEQAVERALDWLARHQDATDGRWDGGTARFRDGSVAFDDDSFTIHCPAGEVCFGECFYWEADTALTGLSLLAFLGSGYTHQEGKFAPVVGKGIDFLLRSQKRDGDLRGPSLAVGMYCHAMATLALCEAYALTGDEGLRPAVEKAVGFLVRSRAVDGLAWRYAPGAPSGDTSILGWVVMALKSAKAVGIPIPPDAQAGVQGWLKRVSKGKDGGLAVYNFDATGTQVTPTMTAEAWACRQFLEVGGPGPASDEAAGYLLANPSDRGDYNIYYLYYGTLAMYQHGGDAWSTWNGRVRDDVVRRQRTQGHMAGSWDPDDSPYGIKGGRIYGTALATLTLEVYYRFLRLYELHPTPSVAPAPGDRGARRAGLAPRPAGR